MYMYSSGHMTGAELSGDLVAGRLGNPKRPYSQGIGLGSVMADTNKRCDRDILTIQQDIS